MATGENGFRILKVDLRNGRGQSISFGDPREHLGGSGLAAALFDKFGLADAPADHPDQPLIFAIGSLTGYFPLMSKVVLGFKSPYHQQYAETHAGGRLALALRFAKIDGLVITGSARTPSCLVVGREDVSLLDVHYLWGLDVLTTGKLLRKVVKATGGQRSIVRIGPAGERGVAYASINVDTYRHFGRLGGGAAMGSKNLKAIVVLGDGSLDLPAGKEYANLYRDIYKQMTQSEAMRKYHDLGTPENIFPLNEMRAMPWRNLQATHDEAASNISGETFADELLLRKTACSGCPVGCIHIGLLREKFATESEYIYRQVSYDYEPIFAAGSMLGMTKASDILTLLEEIERQGLDVMSAGVAFAWATEAFEKGLISEKETLIPLAFNRVEGYRKAIHHLGMRTNDFYRLLGQGAKAAADHYGGGEFACVLGQEMAGYATGEVYFVSQAYGFRHSHLDSGGYAFDQSFGKDVQGAVNFLLEEERKRIQLTSMVACLFSRKVYSEERLREALTVIGKKDIADHLDSAGAAIQRHRFRIKFRTGYDPAKMAIPERFREIRTWKGPIDRSYLDALSGEYARVITNLAQPG